MAGAGHYWLTSYKHTGVSSLGKPGRSLFFPRKPLFTTPTYPSLHSHSEIPVTTQIPEPKASGQICEMETVQCTVRQIPDTQAATTKNTFRHC